MLLAKLLRRIADRLDPPGQPPRQPDLGGLDLTSEEGAHRSEAALGLMDDNVTGWVQVVLHHRDKDRDGISIEGFVPKDAYAAFAETMRRVEGVLDQ